MARNIVNVIWSKLSLKQVLLILLVSGIILPIVLFSLHLARTTNTSLQQTVDEFAEQTVRNNAQQLENIVASISYAAAYITGDSEMKANAAAISRDPSSPQALFAREDIIRFVRSISNANLYTLEPQVRILFPNGYVLSGENYYQSDNLDILFSTFADGRNAIWYTPGTTVTSDLDSYWAIRYFGEIVGLLQIHIPGENFWPQLTNHLLLQYRQEIWNSDVLISANQADQFSDAQEASTYRQPLRRWGMTLVVIIPRQLVSVKVAEQTELFFWFFLALILFLLICILMISGGMGRSIRKIVAQAQKIQQGDLSPQPSPNSYREINLLSTRLNDAAVRIQCLMDEAARQAQLKEQMYYEALMAQINPHFLYNTLNSIKWLAAVNGSQAVAGMLDKLGGTLRYAFHQSAEQATVRQELDFLDNYVALLQLRYGNTVTFQKQVPEVLLDECIPRFCIQPLIENALTHGLYAMHNGVVCLTVQAHGDNLRITVSDNGLGMEQEKAERTLHEPHPTGAFNGIGIWNIQQRIRLLFGEPYGLTITSSPNCGCTVEIWLPRQGNEDSKA